MPVGAVIRVRYIRRSLSGRCIRLFIIFIRIGSCQEEPAIASLLHICGGIRVRLRFVIGEVFVFQLGKKVGVCVKEEA